MSPPLWPEERATSLLHKSNHPPIGTAPASFSVPFLPSASDRLGKHRSPSLDSAAPSSVTLLLSWIFIPNSGEQHLHPLSPLLCPTGHHMSQADLVTIFE